MIWADSDDHPEEIEHFDFFVNFNIYLSYKLKADITAVLLCNNFDRGPLTARKTEFGVSSSVVRIVKLKVLSSQKSASIALYRFGSCTFSSQRVFMNVLWLVYILYCLHCSQIKFYFSCMLLLLFSAELPALCHICEITNLNTLSEKPKLE